MQAPIEPSVTEEEEEAEFFQSFEYSDRIVAVILDFVVSFGEVQGITYQTFPVGSRSDSVDPEHSNRPRTGVKLPKLRTM